MLTMVHVNENIYVLCIFLKNSFQLMQIALKKQRTWRDMAILQEKHCIEWGVFNL